MSQAIYWAKSDSAAPLINHISWPAGTLMFLERLPLTWLDEEALATGLRFEPFQPETPFDRWERGRVFNRQGELRWEKIDGRFWLVYTGGDDVALPAEFTRDETLSLGAPETRTYYLWGRRLEAEALAVLDRPASDRVFAEFRVGGILTDYPVTGSPSETGRVKLAVAEYFDPATGERLYYRFQGVDWDESV